MDSDISAQNRLVVAQEAALIRCNEWFGTIQHSHRDVDGLPLGSRRDHENSSFGGSSTTVVLTGLRLVKLTFMVVVVIEDREVLVYYHPAPSAGHQYQ